MAGDDLTICLFLVGLAASFLLAAMSQAGWKHRVLIACLFGVAAIFLALGVSWLWIKDLSPVLRSILVPIATSPVAWFCVILLALSAHFVLPSRAKVSSEIKSPDRRDLAPTTNTLISGSVHVARMLLRLHPLLRSGCFEIDVFVFNATNVPLTFSGVSGSVTYYGLPRSKHGVSLAPAAMTSEQRTVPPHREGQITLVQAVNSKISDEMRNVFAAKSILVLGLHDIRIEVSPANGGDPKRFLLWDTIRCRPISESPFPGEPEQDSGYGHVEPEED
jgi:hypothetical protein